MFFIYVVIDITGMPISGNGFYIPKEKSPSVCHLSNTDAVTEAERLATKHPGRTFAVFSANSFVMASKPEPKIHMLRQIDTTQKRRVEAMSDELFTDAAVAMDSPRLRWRKKHDVHTADFNDCQGPWAAWIGDFEEAADRGESNPYAGGYARGETEDDAIRLLANATGLRLWNEEEAYESR